MPFYYTAAFVVLYFLRLRGRSRGWKRTLLAFVGGLVVAGIVGYLLSRLLGLVLGSTGIDVPESLPMGLLSWGISIALGIVDILIAVGAIAWLVRQQPVGDAVSLVVGAPGAAGGAAFIPVPAPASPPSHQSPHMPTSSSLDATAAETLRLLVSGLSDPQAEVRRDCATMMASKFLPALEHETDVARRNAAVVTVRTLAAELRPPRDAAEREALFHAVKLYTLLTSQPADE